MIDFFDFLKAVGDSRYESKSIYIKSILHDTSYGKIRVEFQVVYSEFLKFNMLGVRGDEGEDEYSEESLEKEKKFEKEKKLFRGISRVPFFTAEFFSNEYSEDFSISLFDLRGDNPMEELEKVYKSYNSELYSHLRGEVISFCNAINDHVLKIEQVNDEKISSAKSSNKRARLEGGRRKSPRKSTTSKSTMY